MPIPTAMRFSNHSTAPLHHGTPGVGGAGGRNSLLYHHACNLLPSIYTNFFFTAGGRGDYGLVLTCPFSACMPTPTIACLLRLNPATLYFASVTPSLPSHATTHHHAFHPPIQGRTAACQHGHSLPASTTSCCRLSTSCPFSACSVGRRAWWRGDKQLPAVLGMLHGLQWQAGRPPACCLPY